MLIYHIIINCDQWYAIMLSPVPYGCAWIMAIYILTSKLETFDSFSMCNLSGL